MYHILIHVSSVIAYLYVKYIKNNAVYCRFTTITGIFVCLSALPYYGKKGIKMKFLCFTQKMNYNFSVLTKRIFDFKPENIVKNI